jgi:hypothetical protein
MMLKRAKPKKLKELKQEHAKKAVSKSPFDSKPFVKAWCYLELKPKPNGRFIQNTLQKLIQSIDKRNDGKVLLKNLLLPVELFKRN